MYLFLFNYVLSMLFISLQLPQ